MRLSRTYWKTLKETPSDAEIASHKLMTRAGMIYKTSSGLYSYLAFAMRTLRKIENIIHEELEAIGSAHIQVPMVTPGELWKESGRWDQMSDLMLKMKDRAERDLCLSPTNEETFTDLFRKTVQSYKELPVSIYQINTKFRDEIRPRFGLLRCREFLMKDAYTFDIDKEGIDKSYNDFFKAYTNIFKRMGLEFISVEADAGAMGSVDSQTHEFQVVANSGEDQLVVTKDLSYSANIEKARTYRVGLEFAKPSKLQEVETPNCKTIEEVCSHLNIAQYQSLKSLVYKVIWKNKEVFFLIMLLGDDSLNELKLKNHLNADHVLPATEKEIRDLGLVKGFIGPQGLNEKLNILFDLAIDENSGFVTGANKENYHVTGFTPDRDLKGSYKIADLRMAKIGDVAPDLKTPIEFKKGIEVGHIFQLGDKYTKALKAEVLSESGKKVFPLMGCYGIGVSRTMAAAVEQNHDDNGIIWPLPIAPFEIYFAVIGKSDETKKRADQIYQDLKSKQFDILFDDRGLGPGPMFKDADLLGLPIRVVLGERDFKESGELEIKLRKTGETIKVKEADLSNKLNELRAKLC